MSAIPAQAVVDRRAVATSDAIGLLGLFVRLAWEMPEVMDFFPDTGEVDLREVDIHGHAFYLAAIHPEDTGEWVARPSRYALKPGAVPFQRLVPGINHDPGDQHGWILAIVEAFKVSAPTAAEALDTLEAALRPAIEEGVRIDLDEIVRRSG
jgi:hypothetical protein